MNNSNPSHTYLDLPLETLYELLKVAVQEMIAASDSRKEDALIDFRTKKKQVALILDTIEERRAIEGH